MKKLAPKVKNDSEVQQLLLATQTLIADNEEVSSQAIMGLTDFTYPRFINARRRLQTAVTAVLIEEKGDHRK